MIRGLSKNLGTMSAYGYGYLTDTLIAVLKLHLHSWYSKNGPTLLDQELN